jgi:outer membrane protein
MTNRSEKMKRALSILAPAVLMVLGSPAWSYEAGDWVLRAGITTVDPDASSDNIVLPGATAEADVDDDTQLGILGAYMVTNNIGIELLAATPFKHNIEADVVGGPTLDAGDTKQLPPTLSVQWYPRGGSDGWQPYIGVGLNYTVFFNEEVNGELIDTLGALIPGVDNANLDLDESFGLAAQAGVDIPVGENLSVNLGVWYMDISTEATITAYSAGDSVAEVEFDVDIDPWVYNVGIAYKF